MLNSRNMVFTQVVSGRDYMIDDINLDLAIEHYQKVFDLLLFDHDFKMASILAKNRLNALVKLKEFRANITWEEKDGMWFSGDYSIKLESLEIKNEETQISERIEHYLIKEKDRALGVKPTLQKAMDYRRWCERGQYDESGTHL